MNVTKVWFDIHNNTDEFSSINSMVVPPIPCIPIGPELVGIFWNEPDSTGKLKLCTNKQVGVNLTASFHPAGAVSPYVLTPKPFSPINIDGEIVWMPE